MTVVDTCLDKIGQWIGRRIARPVGGPPGATLSDPDLLRRSLQLADVVLVDGNQKVGTAIKYLTQSTWSHAALYIGDEFCGSGAAGTPTGCLIEANVGEGVVILPLAKYAAYNTRICRASGLNEVERRQVVRFAIERTGNKYDTRNIIDLARYLLPTPPVPLRWRRRIIALGSGEPTLAICSTLIAQAFQSVRYPILPVVERIAPKFNGGNENGFDEILHIRHHSLFAPRDFDLSPYFQIVKPTIEAGIDHRALNWAEIGPDR